MYSLSVEEAEILFSAESLASYFVDAREEEQQVRPLRPLSPSTWRRVSRSSCQTPPPPPPPHR